MVKNKRLKLAVDEVIEIMDGINKLSKDYSFFLVEGSIDFLKMDNNEYRVFTNCMEYLKNYLLKNEDNSDSLYILLSNFYHKFEIFYKSIIKKIFYKKFKMVDLTNIILELTPIYEEIIDKYSNKEI